MKYISLMHGHGKLTAIAGCAALLVACGGGGGGTPPANTTDNTPSPFNVTAAQGRWTQSDLTALVLPGTASGSAEVWMVNQTPTYLHKYVIDSSANVSGYQYPLSGSGSRQVFSGVATLNATASPRTLALGSTYSLTQSDALTGSSSLSDVAGNWTFTVNQGAVKFIATITATGALAASTVSDDCTYAGQLTATSVATLYKISYQSTCQGTTSSLSGVARWVAAGNALTVLAVSTDGQSASLISMSKP